jgi:hypothetical protein
MARGCAALTIFCDHLHKLQSRRSNAAEIARAGFAGTHGAEIVEAEDAGGMSVGEFNFYGVVADGLSGARAGLRLVERQNAGCRWFGGTRRCCGFGGFFGALVSTRGAGTIFAQINKIEVAGMAVGPRNIHTRAGGDVNFHVGGLLAGVEWGRHVQIIATLNAKAGSSRCF